MIKRLMLEDDESWVLYPQMARRVKQFAGEHDLTSPIEPILYEMRQRWLMVPNLAGYFVGVENNVVYSHLVSWINPYYGKNRLYIYQAQNEKGKDAFPEFKSQMQDWIVKLNTNLAEKVEKAEFCTWHEPEKW